LQIVSLFAGAGGLDIAACSTGLVDRLLSSDSNQVFLQTLIDNMPTHFPAVDHRHVAANACDLTASILQEAIGTKNIDIVMGGPPCDDFTCFGKRRGLEGTKAALVFEFSRLVLELRPRAFLFENVPNLKRQFPNILNDLIASFRQVYDVRHIGLLSASDYGSPTRRERLLVVGFLSEEMSNAFSSPVPTHGDQDRYPMLFESEAGRLPFVTVADVLQDLPDVTERPNQFFNHTGRPHRPETVRKMKMVLQGMATSQSFRYRAPWNGLCRSLTAGVDHSTKSYLHPLYDREMSVREYAKIHGFPDTWVFSGNHHNGIKQVANAVPVPLGKAMLGSLVRAIGFASSDPRCQTTNNWPSKRPVMM